MAKLKGDNLIGEFYSIVSTNKLSTSCDTKQNDLI
jgi:hypothetical protein